MFQIWLQPQHHTAWFALIAHSPKLRSDRRFSRENVNVCCTLITTVDNSMLQMDMNEKND